MSMFLQPVELVIEVGVGSVHFVHCYEGRLVEEDAVLVEFELVVEDLIIF